MPNSAIGLLIFVAFLLPGFAFVVRARMKLTLFSEGRSQIEIVLQGLLLSVFVHLALIAIATIVVLIVCIAKSSPEPLTACLKLECRKLLPQELKATELWRVLLILLYLVAAIAAGWFGAHIYAWRKRKKDPVPDDVMATVGRAKDGMDHFVIAWLENGFSITGNLTFIQRSIPDTGKRAILLEDATITDQDGHNVYEAEEAISQKGMVDGGVKIYTSDIKMIALVNSEKDKEQTEE